MLAALLGGVARPAGELARCAGVSAPTASGHLARLVQGGLLRVTTSGRHRYYALAGEPVARLLESLALIAPAAAARDARAAFAERRLRQARTCYDHLAGALGVMRTSARIYAEVRALPDLFPRAGASGRNPRRDQVKLVRNGGRSDHADPIADMLTRLRNGVSAKHDFVVMPASKLKVEIAKSCKMKASSRILKSSATACIAHFV